MKRLLQITLEELNIYNKGSLKGAGDKLVLVYTLIFPNGDKKVLPPDEHYFSLQTPFPVSNRNCYEHEKMLIKTPVEGSGQALSIDIFATDNQGTFKKIIELLDQETHRYLLEKLTNGLGAEFISSFVKTKFRDNGEVFKRDTLEHIGKTVIPIDVFREEKEIFASLIVPQNVTRPKEGESTELILTEYTQEKDTEYVTVMKKGEKNGEIVIHYRLFS